MASGSHRDLIKVIGNYISSTEPPHPIPDHVEATIEAYFQRHPIPEEYDAQRLQDDLLTIHSKTISSDVDRHPAFLAVLRLLQPAILGTDRLLEWWDLLVRPTLDSARLEKAVLADAHAILINILVYDEDDDETGEAARASRAFTTRLMDTYMEKSTLASGGTDDIRFRLVAGHLESVLVSFGKKRSKLLLSAIDRYLVDPKRRLQSLSLLCSFLRHQPPHLHQVLNTGLFEHLLKCLMNDTSSTAVTLALTNLVMLLPHIPASLSAYLPRLFIIYARLVCWDRLPGSDTGDTPPEDAKLGSPSSVTTVIMQDPTWRQLNNTSDAPGTFAPDAEHLFTHLYGMYPLNFVAFVREPTKCLQNTPFGQLELDEETIQERTDHYREVHLLHPNFYTMTAETELSDMNRWMKSEPADILAQCMSLCVMTSAKLAGSAPGPPPTERLPDIPESMIPTEDIPVQSLLSTDEDGVFSDGSSLHRDSWRTSDSTAASAMPMAIHHGETSLVRNASQLSLGQRSRSDRHGSWMQSPMLASRGSDDSPTLPPQQVEPKLQDMLLTQETLRLGMHQSLANDSMHSLATHETSSPRVDAYIHSLAASTVARSPAFRATNRDSQSTIAHLQQEVVLLKNNLNFERYLKQQQSIHIGQLQKRHISEATVEAETQNLINANRGLKLKLEASKKSYSMLKAESLKTKMHSKKWQEELNAKLRALREEQKQWNMDEETVHAQLRNAKSDCDQLRKLLVEAEKKELFSRQKLASVQQDLDEIDQLKAQIEALSARVRHLEAKELAFLQAEQRAEDADALAEQTRMKLRARDGERDRIRKAYEERIQDLELKLATTAHSPSSQPPAAFQAMLDSALAASRSRLAVTKKAHQQLLEKYQALEMQYLELRAAREFRRISNGRDIDRESIMTDEIHPLEMDDASIVYNQYAIPAITRPRTSPSQNFRSPLLQSPTSPYMHRQPTFPLDGSVNFSAEGSEGSEGNYTYNQNGSQAAGRTLSAGYGQLTASQSQGQTQGQMMQQTRQSSVSKQKIMPGSEVRVRGRGGVQNIGKKEKDKKDKKGGSDEGGGKSSGKTGLRALIGS